MELVENFIRFTVNMYSILVLISSMILFIVHNTLVCIIVKYYTCTYSTQYKYKH